VLGEELIPKIHALTNSSPCRPSGSSPAPLRGLSPLRPLFPGVARPPLSLPLSILGPPLPRQPPITSIPTIVAIGVSTGGPAALDVLLPSPFSVAGPHRAAHAGALHPPLRRAPRQAL
jgi:chemotaxis response regulator CheB